MNLDTPDKVLNFAISREQKAADFFKDLADKMGDPMRDVFLGFSKEEMNHKASLIAVKKGHRFVTSKQAITDLKIGDDLVDPELRADMTYQDALIVAIKAEKAAVALYNSLAEVTDDASLRELFLSLAREEAKHKLRFETEYDDVILTEN